MKMTFPVITPPPMIQSIQQELVCESNKSLSSLPQQFASHMDDYNHQIIYIVVTYSNNINTLAWSYKLQHLFCVKYTEPW